jgi:pimeloyl-ACP methyl ester carboxylesterase
MARLYRSYDAASMAAAHRAVSRWVLSLAPLRKLNVPTFLLAWEGDLQHELAIAQRMAALLPRAKLKVILGVFTPNLGSLYWAMMRNEPGNLLPEGRP